jgi:hypothetical protein
MTQGIGSRIATRIAWIAVAMIVALCASPAVAQRYTQDQLFEDARQLAQIIEDTHPDPFVHCGGRIAFYRAFQDVLEAIPAGGMVRDDFVRILRPWIALVGDGHTDIWEDYRVSSSTPGGVPLSLGVIEESLYVAGVRRGDDPELIGAKLLSVEGVPLAELCERQRQVQGTENDYFVLYILSSQSLYYRPHMQDLLPEWEDQSRVRVELELASGEIREVEYTLPKGMRYVTRPTSAIKVPPSETSGFVWTFWDEEQKTAYLRVDHMLEYREAYEIWCTAGSRDLTDEELAAKRSATESFRDLVIAMKEAGTETLIVDVRENEGGNSMMADILLNFLYPRDVFLDAMTQHITSGGGEIRRYSNLYFEGCENETIEDYADVNAVPMAVGEYDFSADFADPAKQAEVLGQSGTPAFLSDWYEMAPTFYDEYLSEEYAGYYTPENVLVVTTAHTFSSGYTLAKYLYLAGATLVGTPSGQTANCYGEIIWWELDNTGVYGGVSGTKYLYFPEESELARVLPVHHTLTYEKLASYDFDPNAWLRYALELAEESE